jgi:hypothetical protein
MASSFVDRSNFNEGVRRWMWKMTDMRAMFGEASLTEPMGCQECEGDESMFDGAVSYRGVRWS